MPGHDASGKRSGARRVTLDHSLPLEERIAEARKLRAKALGVPLERLDEVRPAALRMTTARQTAQGPGQRAGAGSLMSLLRSRRWRWDGRVVLAGRLLVVFTAAVGLGFGGVLGIARVSDISAPPETALQSVDDAGPPALSIAGLEHTSSEWPAALRNEDLMTKLDAPHDVAPVTEIWDAPRAMPPPDAPTDAAITIPVIEHVRYAPTAATIDSLTVAQAQPKAGAAGDVAPNQDGASGFPQQVFIHAPTGTSGRLLRQISDELAAAGIEVARVGRESFRISQTHIRYYSAGTADPARVMAEALGIEARDFSNTARPIDRIELWVAGGARSEPPPENERSSNPFRWLINRL